VVEERAYQVCIGYVVLSFDFSLEYGGKNAWIDELFVRPEFRGHGIGSRTLDFAAQTARELAAKVLHLEVNRDNPAQRARIILSRAGLDVNWVNRAHDS